MARNYTRGLKYVSEQNEWRYFSQKFKSKAQRNIISSYELIIGTKKSRAVEV